jgi:hypothetical protein
MLCFQHSYGRQALDMAAASSTVTVDQIQKSYLKTAAERS